MKKHIKPTALVVLTLVMLIAGAMVTMIVGYASDYYTYTFYYQYEDGTTAHDPYIAVFEKNSEMNLTVKNPIIQGYQPYDSLAENANLATQVELRGTITGNQTRTFYYKPEMVPFRVSYFLQNINDDDYTATLTLPDSYYQKSGMTGTFPEDMEDFSNDPNFKGFTKLYHTPDFIAADGSTEFEIYFSRNYYLIDFLLDGGYGTESVYAKYDSNYHIAEPTKKGYVFKGWVLSDKDGNFINENGDPLTDAQAAAAAEKFTNGRVPAKDVFYKAYWVAGESMYSIVYYIEDPDDGTYADVASLEVSQYHNGTPVMTDDVISVNDEKNSIPDFFTGFNLNPQDVEMEDGHVKLDSDLRPIYKRNANGQPIDKDGRVLDFPDMSPGEREELNGKGRYFEIDTEKSNSSATVSGDGTTRFNVYYKRREITQRFFFARKLKDTGVIEIPGWTRCFSGCDATFDQHLARYCPDYNNHHEPTKHETQWMELSDTIPQIKQYYKNKYGLEVKEYDSVPNNATYYYYERKTKYYADLRDNWINDAFDPLLIIKNKESGVADPDYARFGAWSVEWGTKYAHRVNKTVKGVYEKLDDELLYEEEYIAKKDAQDKPYVDDPFVLNYLSFWTNAKNQPWNKKNAIYNFTYKNYVEILPGEYTADGLDWNGEGGYIDTIKVTYNVENDPTNPHKVKIYGLLPHNVIETYDGAAEYKDPNKRDAQVKERQTATSLTGFALLTKDELAPASLVNPIGTYISFPQNPLCKWYANDDFDANHHADVYFFYRRRYYSLNFMNNNTLENSSQHTRNIYYQDTINSVGIRKNWVYFEPEYPDAAMRKYFTFDGWCFDENHTETIPTIDNDPAYSGTQHQGKRHFNSTFRMPADDITLYAKWIPTTEHVIFYQDYEHYQDDHKLSESYVPFNTLALTKDIPSTVHEEGRPYLASPVEGATFIGWYYENEDGNEKRFEPEDMPVTRELKLYAKWTSDKKARYQVKYVVKGTDTPVADPTTGVSFVSSTNSFKAKTGSELYEEYRYQASQTRNWFPVVTSHSILVHKNEGGEYDPNTYTFEYYQKDKVWYKVRYLDAYTLEPLHVDKTVETGNPIVSENYEAIEGYIPDKMVKTLAPAASDKEDADEAQAEELAKNIIIFFYTKNNTEAPVRIEYYVQDVDKPDPTNTANYTFYGKYKFDKALKVPDAQGNLVDNVINFDTEVFNTPIAEELTNSHFTLNTDLTSVNDVDYTGQVVKVIPEGVVIKLYYQRGKYPYKVLYVDLDQEILHNRDPEQYPGDGVLQSIPHVTPEEMLPLGAVVSIEYPKTLTVQIEGNDVTYYAEKDPPQPLTIRHEDYDAENPDPKVNVKKIYFTAENPRLHIHYEKRVINAVGEVDEDFAYLLPENKEIVYDNVDIKGCTAEANPDYGDKYEFIGWYDKEKPTDTADGLLETDAYYQPERPTVNRTFYAIFKMNYTLNYVYQGRRGGNDGSYTGDDAPTDEKVYSVILKNLKTEDLDGNGMPLPKHFIDNAPAVDDLYKDCIWTIDNKHITFDKATLTATITADQPPRTCIVEFFNPDADEPFKVEKVKLNTLVMPNGKFVEAPESDNGNPFAYWSVKETATGKEIAKCFDRAFDLRATGDITVTACYEVEAQRLFISDASYSREQTKDAAGQPVDKLYADFILAYMEKDGKLLNPKYDNAVTDNYKTGLIVEYDPNIMLTKQDEDGETLSDDDKTTAVYPSGDVLSNENAKKLANGETLTGTEHRYFCYAVANDKYNNHNRVDRVISFINSPTARHLVLRAYYYVWNTDKEDGFEITEPVYFYLYDIGNSVKQTVSE